MKFIKRLYGWAGLTMLAVLVSTSLALAQSYDLTRGTVDSGGGTIQTTGGTYAMKSSIGQPDVGVHSDASGTYSLAGGIWEGGASSGPGPGPEDVNTYLPLLLRN